jgi:hypothetical protein
VSQDKFSVLKIMQRYNFGKFMKFLPKDLNPFNIQSDFKLGFLLNFIIQNPGRIGSWAKKDVCLFWIYPSTCQIWKFFELSKKVICIFETRALEFIGKEVNKRKSVNGRPPSLCGPAPCQTGLRCHQSAQPTWAIRFTARALGAVWSRRRRYDPAAFVRTAAARGFWPRHSALIPARP